MTWSAHRCRACFTPLEGEPSWKTLCKRCFVQSKKNELEELLQENVELKVQLAMAKRTSPAIDPQMLRTLIQLCHPDRHADSAAANKATQFLLAMKREGIRA